MKESQVTQDIAELACSYRFERLPQDVIQMAKLAILDHVGLAIRGVREDLTQILSQELLSHELLAWHLIPGALGTAHLPNLAMLRAASSHAVDYDDTLLPAQAAHLGSTVIGAVLVLAGASQASGREIVTAVVAGYEVAARVGTLMQGMHSVKGFHPTGTIGVFGAAAACASLLKLEPRQTQVALGLAATQASGLKFTFGSMAKPFNAGHASANGLLSARLASRGFVAPLSALDAEKGFLDVFMGVPLCDRQVECGETYRILENLFKFHAACHATHPLIEGLKNMMSTHGFVGEDVCRLRIGVSSLSLHTARIGVPRSGLECKFSFTQVAGSVLAGLDTAADETYSDQILQNPVVNRMRKKIVVYENPDITPLETNVAVQLNNGDAHWLHYNYPDPDIGNIESVGSSVIAKFIHCTESSLGARISSELMARVLSLDTNADCWQSL